MDNDEIKIILKSIFRNYEWIRLERLWVLGIEMKNR